MRGFLTMTSFFQRGRVAVVLVLCALISACSATTTQTSSVSSYSGSLGTSVDAKRKAKIEAARKRAKANRIKRQKAFAAKRASKSAKAKSTEARLKKQRALKKARKAKATKKNTRRTTKTAKRRKAVTKKGKVKRIKKSTNAFVGGRSKGIVRNAPWKCVPGRLKTVITQISKKYGKVIVNSTHRSTKRNRKVGGKRRSYHLRCQAVDFRVRGTTKGLTRWLARHPLVGGYKRYPAGHYHIDTGPKRTW